jgi:hypothetical protein
MSKLTDCLLTVSGILPTAPWSVRQLVMSLSRFAQPRRLHVETGVHVRLTESLNVSCNIHLELSGSRAKPTAARRGVIISSRLPIRGKRFSNSPCSIQLP